MSPQKDLSRDNEGPTRGGSVRALREGGGKRCISLGIRSEGIPSGLPREDHQARYAGLVVRGKSSHREWNRHAKERISRSSHLRDAVGPRRGDGGPGVTRFC
jgi:hypothetical protein